MAYNPLLFDAVDDQTILRVTNDKLVIDHNAMRVVELGSHGITEYPYFQTTVAAGGIVGVASVTVRLMSFGPLKILQIGRLAPVTGTTNISVNQTQVTYNLTAFFTAIGQAYPRASAGCIAWNTPLIKDTGSAWTLADGTINVGSLSAYFSTGAGIGHEPIVLEWVDSDVDTQHTI